MTTVVVTAVVTSLITVGCVQSVCASLLFSEDEERETRQAHHQLGGSFVILGVAVWVIYAAIGAYLNA